MNCTQYNSNYLDFRAFIFNFDFPIACYPQGRVSVVPRRDRLEKAGSFSSSAVYLQRGL
jgi:hypothetical protein